MKDEQRITVLEDELKILKNEIKAVLLDLREQYLNIQNPFNQNMVPSAGGVNPVMLLEQKEEQPDADDSEDEDNAAVDTGNGHCETEATNDPVPEVQSHKSQQEISANNSRIQSGTYETELQRMPSRNDMTGVWPRTETSKQEDYSEGALPRSAVSSNEKKNDQEIGSNRQVDLVVIAGLSQWLDQAITKLGKERTEVLVEISFTMGRLPQNLKDALTKMARLSHQDSANTQPVAASDYLSILAQLDNLLSDTKQQDNALLSIISMMKDSRNG